MLGLSCPGGALQLVPTSGDQELLVNSFLFLMPHAPHHTTSGTLSLFAWNDPLESHGGP